MIYVIIPPRTLKTLNSYPIEPALRFCMTLLKSVPAIKTKPSISIKCTNVIGRKISCFRTFTST